VAALEHGPLWMKEDGREVYAQNPSALGHKRMGCNIIVACNRET
jgi:hypothetical protein